MTLDLPAPAKPGARILVVDDEQSIAYMLQKLLSAAGYQVDVLHKGRAVLERMHGALPDLVLLDVMMPDLDGLEVCRALKSDPRTAIVPVLMITALADRKQRLEGVAAGADDYLTKPIDHAELLLRVGNAVRMKSLYDRLAQSYARLREAEALRDDLIHLVVHDLRTPLQGLLGYLQLLGRNGTEDRRQRRYLSQAQESGNMLLRLVEDILAVHKMESGQMELHLASTSLGEIWASVHAALASTATMQDVELVSFVPADAYPLQADRDLLCRVLVNLVGNALRFTPSGGRVEVSAREVSRAADGPGWVVVSVQDSGPGIPREYYQKIFEKFGVVETMQSGTRRSTGLGLSFCKLAVEAHRGRIGVESAAAQGCMFWFALPLREHSALAASS